jgi:outer membrane protein TolC
MSHRDPIEIDNHLSLAQVVSLTLEKYPGASWLTALEQEAEAIQQRSKSWFAGSASAYLFYQEATSGTLHYGDASVKVPLWNAGQRSAEATLANQAANNAENQGLAIKLRVAGLVRIALWDLTLQKVRYEQAQSELSVYGKLFNKIEKRVELGDLARADLLLAKTELLQKRSILTQAEAELMHARKRYSTVTQMTKVPAEFSEALSNPSEVQQNHPALAAINSQISRKQAELHTTKTIGSGQTDIALGINTDESFDPRSNKTESFNITLNVPFGGSAHLAPKIAAINVELNQLLADREHLVRNLEQAYHEAEHNLEVNEVELKIANELKDVAEQHLKITEFSFSAGEINLIDLLKIQARTQQAILNAKERQVVLERDKAFFNQAAGIMP